MAGTPSAQERIAAQAAAPPSGGVAAPDRQMSLLDWLHDPVQQEQLKTSLPRQIDPDRFVRVIVTQCKQSPDIMQCTRDSVLGAMLQAGQLGLEPGPLGLSYFVPFNNNRVDPPRKEVSFQIGYKGMIDLARRSGQLASIEGRTVYDGDDFEFSYGTGDNKFLRHQPCPPSKRPPTEKLAWPAQTGVSCYYVVAEYVNGGSNFEVVWPEVVEEHRLRSKMPTSPAWKNDYHSMAWKTGIRIMSRFLPMTAEAGDAIAQDDQVLSFGRLTDPDIINATATEAPPAAPAADGTCPECGAAKGQAHEQGCKKG